MVKSRLLLTEQPLVINKELAKVMGLNEAIILQQIEYWININEKSRNSNNFKEGFYWTYNTIDQWQEEFPFWSYNTVKRTLAKLEKLGILITATLNRKGYDRTKWYRIDYNKLDSLNSNSSKWANEEKCDFEEVETNKNTSEALKTDNSSKWANAIAQNELMDQPILSSPIPETNTETNTEIINNKNKGNGFSTIINNYTDNKELKDTIVEFIKMRKANRSTMTDRALTMLLNKLNKLAFSDIEKNEVLNNSIVNSWKTIYPLDSEKNKSNNQNMQSNKELKFNNFDQRTYDYNQLERQLLGWDEDK